MANFKYQNIPTYWVFLSVIETDRKDIKSIIEEKTGYSYFDGNTFFQNRGGVATDEQRKKEAYRLAKILPYGTKITVFFAVSNNFVYCNPFFNPETGDFDTIECTNYEFLTDTEKEKILKDNPLF